MSTSGAPPAPSHGAAPADGLDVAAENALPGTPGWRARPSTSPQAPSGYLDHDAVAPGEPVVLRASSRTGAVRVRVYRVGWYGGAGARLVLDRRDVDVLAQPAPTELEPTGAVTAPWRPVATLGTAGWPPGFYAVRLDDGRGRTSWVPLVVRSPSTAGRVVLGLSTLTWQAYNTWGGRSLYVGEDEGFAGRSTAVSFDRPYDQGGWGKSAQFDLPLVQAAERTGLPLAYASTRDVAVSPDLLQGAAGYVSDGHDEYWTPGERRAVERARDAGTNLAFLGANVAYWRVRLAEGPSGPGRLVVGYKDAARDPLSGPQTTVRFRDPPGPAAEEALTGQRYECYPAHGAFVVRDPSFFLFAGTGAQEGSRYPGLVGVEIDRPYPSAAALRPLQVPSLSPVDCRGRATWSALTYHAAPGGAGTVAVGTMNWVRALVEPQPQYGIGPVGARFVQQVTATLLTSMAAGPMGADHPSTDDLAALDLPATSTVGGP